MAPVQIKANRISHENETAADDKRLARSDKRMHNLHAYINWLADIAGMLLVVISNVPHAIFYQIQKTAINFYCDIYRILLGRAKHLFGCEFRIRMTVTRTI